MTQTPPARRRGATVHLVVARTEQLTPHMVRVVGGGPGFDDFVANGFTDAYVKIVFPRAGVTYPHPLDMGLVRETMPRADWPVTRTYTVRWVDHEARELAVDVVQHGDTGLAGPWARDVRPGDPLVFAGPGGAYAPRPEVDAHLLVGDEAALPAIAAALAEIGPGVGVRALIEVADAGEEQTLPCAGDLELTWVHRSAGGPGLAERVRALSWPAGVVQAFVHGETAMVKELRGHLLTERGVATELLSISGYWRRDADEDTFQAQKRAA